MMITNQRLVERNFENKMSVFSDVVEGRFASNTDFAVANTGIPTDIFNTLLIKTGNSEDLFAIRQEITLFKEKACPFSVWLDMEHLNAKWIDFLQEYNLHEAERNVMMKRENTLHVENKAVNKLEISQVENNEMLAKYIDVFISLFAGTTEESALESYFQQFSQKKLGPEVQMFVGCIDDQAVTTGLLIESEETYGIYDVMTKESFRGKGLGSEMFQFLLSQTKDKEKPVVLQASDDGKNIYKRYGFVDVGEMVVFE